MVRGEFGIAVLLCISVTLWASVDERVAIAVGLFVLGQGLVRILAPVLFAGHEIPHVYVQSMAILAMPPALMLTVSAFAVRRRGRL